MEYHDGETSAEFFFDSNDQLKEVSFFSQQFLYKQVAWDLVYPDQILMQISRKLIDCLAD